MMSDGLGTTFRSTRHLPTYVLLAIAIAAFCSYLNATKAPFILDDASAIIGNKSIRSLSLFWDIVTPPDTVATGGRPLLNLSFALNFYLSGENVWGYHITNIFIHILSAFTLFGITRRTLYRLFPSAPLNELILLSGFVAVLWSVHPLQTSSVTYISQRAESLMGLFYLLTLYGYIRSTDSVHRRFWLVLSTVCFGLGVATKEVIATAPVLVLLYDRAFNSNSFRSSISKSRRFYIALLFGLLLLLSVMALSRVDKRISGDLRQHVHWWDYALTEAKVITQYAKLAIWPSPLVFDYGSEILITRFAAALPFVCGVLILIGSAIATWFYSKPLGFLLLGYFIVLAPTSSVVPIALQPMAESRMYLPLAFFIVALVMFIHSILRRMTWVVLTGLSLVFCALTFSRNRDYQSELAMWTDTVRKQPGSSRAHCQLGTLLSDIANRSNEAIIHLEEALRIKPDFAEPHFHLAKIYGKRPNGRALSLAHYEVALQLLPKQPEIRTAYANELANDSAQVPAAITHYEEALRNSPSFALAHNNLANILVRIPGRMEDAIEHYREAVRVDPKYADAHNNLASAYAKLPGRENDAISHYKEALRLVPDHPVAHYNFGNLLVRMSRVPEAVGQYEKAIEANPRFSQAMAQLASALSTIPGRQSHAIIWYESALRLDPESAELHLRLGVALARTGNLESAALHIERAGQIDPSYQVLVKSLLSEIRGVTR